MSSRKIALNGAKADNNNSAYNSQSNFLTLKESYVLSASRSEGEKHEVEIADNEYVEFIFDDNTTWFGNTNTLQELFPDIDVFDEL